MRVSPSTQHQMDASVNPTGDAAAVRSLYRKSSGMNSPVDMSWSSQARSGAESLMLSALGGSKSDLSKLLGLTAE